MLRHWEGIALIVPASIHQNTGYCRYSRSHLGRVRMIVALRFVGFGLEAIGDLLSAQPTQPRLMEHVRTREEEFVEVSAMECPRMLPSVSDTEVKPSLRGAPKVRLSAGAP